MARRLIAKLSPEMADALIVSGLVDRVSHRIHLDRVGGISARARGAGPSKWSVARRVWVAGDWKFLADCDCSDLDLLAEQHRTIASENLARAVEYEALAAELRATGCATVGELDAREDLAA